ncbi:thioredoxin family protein [Isoptericola sp. NEAU-Y5]|uniref:Thioredoxin family protein n=1 Tax=Isoptericola luteus TaxID=2879484 RepID=A0ABS7ZJN9_9MICO|nr:thioredoxin family protein [Isoptericola sp. NEAU-Y5]MCA5894005.1 thioredoxin family protein [Isoptericola sp. NEAU-Y5]
METQVVALGALLLVTAALGALWRSRQGRVRAPSRRADVDWAAHGVTLGRRATFVQLSATVCAPCRATARVLGPFAGAQDGVLHHELDVEQHLDLTSELRVLTTPTVLVLDAGGAEVARVHGAMSTARAREALAAVGDGVTV